MSRRAKPPKERDRAKDDARNLVVMENTGLVRKFCRHIVKTSSGGCHVDRDADDVYQSGVVGLIVAAEKEIPEGAGFPTLAKWYIRNAASRATSMSHGGVRFPVNAVGEIAAFRKAHAALARATGREPTPEEVVATMPVSGPTRKRITGLIRDISHGGGMVIRIEQRELERAESPGQDCGGMERGELIQRALSSLTTVQRRVVLMRHGIGGGRERTLGEIGSELGFSGERARQIYRDAIPMMRLALGVESEAA